VEVSSTGDDRARLVGRYARNVESQRARDAADRYIHFGHWDTPPASDEIDATFPAAQARYDEEVRALAAIRDGDAILDAGCGFGGTLAAIDAARIGVRLVGLNLDPEQLAIAAASVSVRADNTIEWIEGDASELASCEPSSFERILAVESIVHFASRRRFFAHASRVLRPRGRLAISDFVPTAELRAQKSHASAIPFDVERILATGLAPWPDFWGDDADHEALAEACALRTVARIDATAETLPSYAAIADHEGGDPDDPRREGMRLLAWLHERGLVRLVYAGFEKAG
jgi:SAM-dependent methyltransferase